jgi:hypothetical protein
LRPAARWSSRPDGRAATPTDRRTVASARECRFAATALATLLVIGAALLGRSFAKLTDVDPGYDAANVPAIALRGSSSILSR